MALSVLVIFFFSSLYAQKVSGDIKQSFCNTGQSQTHFEMIDLLLSECTWNVLHITGCLGQDGQHLLSLQWPRSAEVLIGLEA